MSLLNQNNKKGKKKEDKKSSTGGSQGGSKFIAKSGKTSNFSVKTHKAGGTRGS